MTGEEKNEQECWNQTAGWKQLELVSLQEELQCAFCHGTSAKKMAIAKRLSRQKEKKHKTEKNRNYQCGNLEAPAVH